FLRNHTAHNLVFKHQAFLTFVSRREANPAMAELTTTTGLPNELAFDLAALGDLFTVRHLRLTDIGLDVELATHTVNQDVQVKLTHPGDDGLAGFFVGLHAERRVFLSQTAQRDAHLFLVSLGLGLHGNRDNRLREVHTLKNDRLVDVAQGVTRGHILHANQRSDITRAHFFDFLALVSVHLHHTADALFLAFDRVDHRVTGRKHARVDTSKGQRTDEGVGGDLECQRSERSLIGSRTLVDFFFVIRIHTLNRRNFGRRRQVVDHGVENQGHALVLEGGTTDSRNDFTGDGTLTQT